MKSCTSGVSRYSLQLLQCFVWEPPPGLICWMWTASTYQYQRVVTRHNKRLRIHSTRRMHADRHNLACAKEDLCRGHLIHAILVERARQTHRLSCAVDNALLVECTRQTQCFSTALGKRRALLSSALDRRTAILPSALERRTGCRVHSTKTLFAC